MGMVSLRAMALGQYYMDMHMGTCACTHITHGMVSLRAMAPLGQYHMDLHMGTCACTHIMHGMVSLRAMALGQYYMDMHMGMHRSRILATAQTPAPGRLENEQEHDPGATGRREPEKRGNADDRKARGTLRTTPHGSTAARQHGTPREN